MRIVEITVPPEETNALLGDIRRLDDVVGLRVARGDAHEPKGDVVTLTTSNRCLYALMRMLEARRIGIDPGRLVTISEPDSVICKTKRDTIEGDAIDVSWEEMDFTIMRESTMRVNGMLVMGAAGALAAIGLATGALHLVLAAMVIAPGFEPITRIALGLVARSRVWTAALRDTLAGYTALLVGAVLAALFLRTQGEELLAGGSDYLDTEPLLAHWLEISPISLLVAAIAGSAGAVLVANNRSVLTAGVLIAHALIPPVAAAGLALVDGDFMTAALSALRWGVEAGVVIVTGLLVFLWKRVTVQKRDMMV